MSKKYQYQYYYCEYQMQGKILMIGFCFYTSFVFGLYHTRDAQPNTIF